MEAYYHKASDLTPDTKQTLERLMGRKLGGEEIISVKSYQPHALEGTPEREKLVLEMAELRERMRAKIAPGVTPEALEAAIDEACAEVRYGPRG